MAKILCPCGCGKSFTPIFHGMEQKYFSRACGNRFRVRKCKAKKRKERLAEAPEHQRNLKFQPAAKSERRKKGHVRPEPKPVEEQLFA